MRDKKPECPRFRRWENPERACDTIDADALLDAGTVPLPGVVQRARKLGPGQVLRVVSGFAPAPLTDKLEGLGFACHTVAIGSDRFQTFITLPETDR